MTGGGDDNGDVGSGSDDVGASVFKGGEGGGDDDEEGMEMEPEGLEVEDGEGLASARQRPKDPFESGASGEGVVERVGRLVGCMLDPDAPKPPLPVNDAMLMTDFEDVVVEQLMRAGYTDGALRMLHGSAPANEGRL